MPILRWRLYSTGGHLKDENPVLSQAQNLCEKSGEIVAVSLLLTRLAVPMYEPLLG